MPKGSSANESSRRLRRTNVRSTATPAAMPAAATPTTVPISPARLRRAGGVLVTCSPGSDIRSRDTCAAKAGDYLVVDGAAGAGPVVGGGLAPLAGAKEDHLVTLAHLRVADVDHELVHAHPTGNL